MDIKAAASSMDCDQFDSIKQSFISVLESSTFRDWMAKMAERNPAYNCEFMYAVGDGGADGGDGDDVTTVVMVMMER